MPAPGKRKYILKEAIKQWPESDRPREKLMTNGPSSLSDSELLAILIGSGSGERNAMDLARDLLKKFEDLSGLESASIEEIRKVRGIGPVKAITVKAGLELGRRFSGASKNAISSPVRASEDVANIYLPQMKNLKKEVFRVALLNTRNKIVKTVTISEGGLAAAVVEPREVFAPAIREAASAVILMHNHPSGDPEPSDDDINLTRRLVSAGKLMNIKVLDHIVFGDGRYYSFSDNEDI
ncbi:MAG: DNA repair protein RadC [Nitrospinae bacterium]|nr:DNA repair protein RadC [Nitrospinota bacterium]